MTTLYILWQTPFPKIKKLLVFFVVIKSNLSIHRHFQQFELFEGLLRRILNFDFYLQQYNGQLIKHLKPADYLENREMVIGYLAIDFLC